MKNGNEMPVSILANVEVFDYLKEKVGERKTRTEAYADLLDKSLAGFVSPFLRKVDYELRPCQCHVTVSDLASEWHWHRATVRSFLDTLEALGQLERTRLTKSVIITMPLQTGHAADLRNVQETPDLADQLRAVLSDWVIGKAELDDIGYECERLVRQALTETGVPGICPKPDNFSSVNLAASDDERAVKICTTALGCIAHAAMQRALRKRRFDNGSEFLEDFRTRFDGDWTGIVEFSRLLARYILDPEAEDDNLDDDDKEIFDALSKPFMALAAKAQEAAYQTGDRKPNV